MIWTLAFSAHCPRVDGENLTCQACYENLAITHVRVEGGPFDGRVLMLLCARCAAPEDRAEHVKAALVYHADLGWVDLVTGGPGHNGAPEVWHIDHWDPMEHEHS